MSERECPYCHRSWPDTTKFFRPKRRKCKRCQHEESLIYNRLWKQRNHERYVLALRRRYAKNKERRQASWLARRLANPEHFRQISRESAQRRRKANPELDRLKHREWYHKNIEACREKNRRRRARKVNNQTETDVTPGKIAELKQRSKGKCYWCGKKAKPMHIDHVEPLSRGGEHMMYNLVVSCAKCNQEKGAQLPGERGVLL